MEKEKHREIRIPSTAAIYSHPIHPMTVTFPIAFLIGVLITDVVFLWTGDAFWARASFWLLVGGVGGGGLAAVAGVTDFVTLPEVRDKVRSWSHFLAAVTVIALATANLALRLQVHQEYIYPWGLLLSIDTVVILAFAGFLGGKLVFHHLVGSYLREEEEP